MPKRYNKNWEQARRDCGRAETFADFIGLFAAMNTDKSDLWQWEQRPVELLRATEFVISQYVSRLDGRGVIRHVIRVPENDQDLRGKASLFLGSLPKKQSKKKTG